MVDSFYQCPLCGFTGELLTFRGRLHAQCPQCRSLERHRLQYAVLMQVFARWSPAGKTALHFAPEASFKALFARTFLHYETADLAAKDVDHQVDLQRLPFADQSYDFVFASHVLEHVADDQQAISEIRRILRPDGIAILPVPVVVEKTIEFSEPDPLQDYHVRAPGLDYYERYQTRFSRVETYSSCDVDAACQPFIYVNTDCDSPLRVDGARLRDLVPVCYV